MLTTVQSDNAQNIKPQAAVPSVQQGLHSSVQFHKGIVALPQAQGRAANLAMVKNHQAAIVLYLA